MVYRFPLACFTRRVIRPFSPCAHRRSYSSETTSSESESFSWENGTRLDHVRTIGIIGAGQMGTGIAIVAALVARRSVILVDSNEQATTRSLQFINSFLNKRLHEEIIQERDIKETMQRIRTATSLKSVHDADFVVEAVREDPTLKKDIFRNLSIITRPEVVLASNTSSISITELAASSRRPHSVLGMHFLFPVPSMDLVEIVSGMKTDPTAVDTAFALANEMRKYAVRCSDMPGFISFRLLMPYINEAVEMFAEGVASAEEIDCAIKRGFGLQLGPLEFADFLGLDTCLAVLEVLHAKMPNTAKYTPHPLLRNYVAAGFLGRKTGRGFYSY